MMDRETLIWLVTEFRSDARSLAIHEVRPQLEEAKRNNDEIMVELRRATDLAERLANDTKGMDELRRQIDEQARHIEKLERQIEDTEFKRGNLESENAQLSRRCETLDAEKQDLEVALKEAEAELYMLGRSKEQSDKGSYVTEDEEQALVDELAGTIEGRKKYDGHK